MSVNYGERERTNTGALYFCIVFVLIYLGFFGYTFCNSSIFRTTNKFIVHGNRHEQEDAFFSVVSKDLSNSWVSILIACFVALVFSYILLILFRYAIKYVIWIVFSSIIVALLAGSIFVLVLGSSGSGQNGRKGDGTEHFMIAGFLFLVATVLFFLLIWFRVQIRLVIQLFKEASKALADIPMLVFEPVLTLLALAVTWIAFLFAHVIIVSSGKFKGDRYEMDGAMQITFVLNIIAVIWFTSFILGCQHFVVASSISEWFFTRTKDKLTSTISRGFSLLIHYHLGSICFGSLMITLLKIVQLILSSAKNSSENDVTRMFACCFESIIKTMEELLQYLVRNAYIIVAKDGTPLFESGKKAFHLLKKHLMEVIALNKVGDFILLIGRIFVVSIAGFVGYELVSRNKNISSPFIPVALCVIFAFLIVHCFMTVYEMTLDTIFICFCEDCEENGGESRPYFMSSGMMKVMRELNGGEFNFGQIQNVEAYPMIQQPYPQPYLQPYPQPGQPLYQQPYSQADQSTCPQFDQPGYPPQPYPPQSYQQQPDQPTCPQFDQPGYPPQPYPPQSYQQQPDQPSCPQFDQPGYPPQPYPPQSCQQQPNQLPYPPKSYQTFNQQ